VVKVHSKCAAAEEIVPSMVTDSRVRGERGFGIEHLADDPSVLSPSSQTCASSVVVPSTTMVREVTVSPWAKIVIGETLGQPVGRCRRRGPSRLPLKQVGTGLPVYG